MNTGSLETLKRGEVLLTSLKGTNFKNPNFPKVQMELAEFVQDPNRTVSALGLLNSDDERFSGSKPRRAWLTVSPKMLEEKLGIEVDPDLYSEPNSDVVQDVNMLNPVIEGQPLRLQIQETVVPDEYQTQHVETTAKRAGKDGDFITHEGQFIFSNTSVVVGEPNNVFLKSDLRSVGTGIKASAIAGAVQD